SQWTVETLQCDVAFEIDLPSRRRTGGPRSPADEQRDDQQLRLRVAIGLRLHSCAPSACLSSAWPPPFWCASSTNRSSSVRRTGWTARPSPPASHICSIVRR